MAISGFSPQNFDRSGTYFTGVVKLSNDSLKSNGTTPLQLPAGGPVNPGWRSPWLSDDKNIQLGELIQQNPGINIFPGPRFEKSDLKPDFPSSSTSGWNPTDDPRIIMSQPRYDSDSGILGSIKRLFSPHPNPEFVRQTWA